jgi:WD40 repeat protein
VVGNNAGEIWFWDATTLRKIGSFAAHNEVPTAIALSPDHQTVATGGRDGVIKLWNVRTWHLTLTLTGHTGDITGLAFSPDGSSLCSASQIRKAARYACGGRRPLPNQAPGARLLRSHRA